MHKRRVSSAAQALKTIAGMPSGPLAFRTSSNRRTDRTLYCLVLISGIEWPQRGISGGVAPHTNGGGEERQ